MPTPPKRPSTTLITGLLETFENMPRVCWKDERKGPPPDKNCEEVGKRFKASKVPVVNLPGEVVVSLDKYIGVDAIMQVPHER